MSKKFICERCCGRDAERRWLWFKDKSILISWFCEECFLSIKNMPPEAVTVMVEYNG